jgi:hypothetical protein
VSAPGADAFAAVERALADEADPDDVLRAVVDALVAGGCAWAGVLFVEDGELVLGPSAGEERAGARERVPVVWDGERVAELVADSCGDRALLDRVAREIAPHCLVGWDTGGVPWDPAA